MTTNRIPFLLRGAALVLLTIAALLSLMPLYWLISGSFKLQQNAMSMPPELWPAAPTFANYQKLLFGPKLAGRWFLNSAIVAATISLAAVLTSSTTGYVLGKKEFPGKNLLLGMVVVTMILPREVMLVPLVMRVRALGLTDTYPGMVAPFLVYPFGIFLMRQFMQTIPNDLIAAAEMDGAGEWRTFQLVILPLARPAIAAVAIFAFVQGWNEYLWQLMIAQREEMLTLPVGVSRLVSSLSSYDLGLAMAGATFAFIPMLLVFVCFQSYFVKGITLGAVKG